jgi:OFA family oxalate/formate antiporter-like MFS transporter
MSGLLVTLLTGNPSAVAAGLVLISGGYGLAASAFPIATRAVFGPEGFSWAFGWIFTAWGAAGLLGPWAAGYLFDRTGSFWAALLLALTAAALAIAVLRPLANTPALRR